MIAALDYTSTNLQIVSYGQQLCEKFKGKVAERFGVEAVSIKLRGRLNAIIEPSYTETTVSPAYSNKRENDI